MTPIARRRIAGLDDLPHALVPRPLFLIRGTDAHALWRTRWVCDELSRRGFVADWVDLDDMDAIAPLIHSGRFNLIVTPRLIFSEPEAQCRTFLDLVHSDGLTWVYEFDDQTLDTDIVDHQLVCFDMCRQVGIERLEYERQARIRMVREADALVVSTPALADVARRFTDRPVHVAPNAIDPMWFLQRVRGVARQEPRLTIGWAGGARRQADLEAVAEAWRRIAARYPDVAFVVFGERMQVLMDAIPKGEHRRIYIPWVELDLYPRGLPHIDIACCSVADTEWNWCKSADKFFEHTLAGSPCVVSRALYGPLVRDGWDALVASTADEWEAALSRLIDDPLLRWQLNTGALETVMRHHTTQFAWLEWVRALSAILAQSNGTVLHEGQSHAALPPPLLV